MTSDAVYFISDAHLGDQLPYPPHRQTDLVNFLTSIDDQMTHLYILGDLFDFWIEYRHAIRPDFFPILHCFRTLVEKGVQVEYVCGNHDFSFGPFLTDIIGIRIHDDPITVNLQGRQIHLIHGDGIIQNDASQRLLKKLLRNRFLHKGYYLLHPTLGVGLGESISMASRRRNRQKKPKYQYTDYRAVAKTLLNRHDMVLMGHTHHPELVQWDDKVYCNTGDWVRHFTYARLQDGRLGLFQYQPNSNPIPVEAIKG